MRIIAGAFGGRKFTPPVKIPARPTTDIAKGGLFNVLENMMDLEDISSLDLFGGTGSISYELASRGAGDMTIVERDGGMIDFIKKTAVTLGITDRLHIVRGDALKFAQQCRQQYHFIFADPPYAMADLQQLPDIIFQRQLLLPDGVFVLEHIAHNDFQQHPQFIRARNYGATTFSFFQQSQEA